MTTKVTGSVLADTAVSAGTYGGTQTLQAFTVDAQGRITYAANITSGVITAGTRGQGADILVPTIQYNALGQIVAATNTTIRTATTSVTGVVQLADSVSNTSTTAAATASAVKAAYDAAGANATTALTSAQANTGAGLISVTSAYQANTGAALLVARANTGALGIGLGGIIDTNRSAAEANTGAVAISAKNADNLSSGTVPSGRISGSYTGITGVGTLAAGSIPGSLISSAVSNATNATNATYAGSAGSVSGGLLYRSVASSSFTCPSNTWTTVSGATCTTGTSYLITMSWNVTSPSNSSFEGTCVFSGNTLAGNGSPGVTTIAVNGRGSQQETVILRFSGTGQLEVYWYPGSITTVTMSYTLYSLGA
jgi:hypothetical protein